MTDEELRRLAEEEAQYVSYTGPKLVADGLYEFARRVAEEARRQERERWEKEIGQEMPSDFKDWHQNSPEERPEVARLVLAQRRISEKYAWEQAEGAVKRAEARVKELEDEVADDLVAANHQIESDEAEIETLRAERDALSADLSLAMSYYICDNGLGLDYHGSDEDFARKSGGKVNAEMERWKRTLGFGEDHRKHPTGDRCVFCNSQWPCEFAPEEVL